MRTLFLILATALMLSPAEKSGAANVTDDSPPAPCQKPDESLLKARGGYISRTDMPDEVKIDSYNAQAQWFNDCTRRRVDSNNTEIDRVREEGNASIHRIADMANQQIGEIQSKIRLAIGGNSSAESLSPDEITGAAFPAPECTQPDKSLLKPVRKKDDKTRASATARTDRYDAQQRTYESCVRAYIEQASAEIERIGISANLQIKHVADEANGRIGGLRARVRGVIATADSAAADEAQAVAGTPLALNNPDGVSNTRFEGSVESVTVESNRLKQSEDTPTGEGDPDTIVCRAPQQLADSRIPGPEICKRNRVWAALQKEGKDISSDGRSIVPSEVSRTTNRAGMNCVKVITGSGYQGYMTTEVCN
jgi:hypothetical protein